MRMEFVRLLGEVAVRLASPIDFSKRVRDYAEIHGKGVVDATIAEFALNQLGVDQHGLDEMDRQILSLIHEKFNGGPVGVETIAAALSAERDTLEEVYEPYLLQEGFIMKTPRGTYGDRCRKNFA